MAGRAAPAAAGPRGPPGRARGAAGPHRPVRVSASRPTMVTWRTWGGADAGHAQGREKAATIVGPEGRALPAGRARLLRRRPPARRARPRLVPARLARDRRRLAGRALVRADRRLRAPARGRHPGRGRRARGLTIRRRPPAGRAPMLHGRTLTLALLVGLAVLATVLAKTAVLAGRPGLAAPLVGGSLLGWLYLFRRVRQVWLDERGRSD